MATTSSEKLLLRSKSYPHGRRLNVGARLEAVSMELTQASRLRKKPCKQLSATNPVSRKGPPRQERTRRPCETPCELEKEYGRRSPLRRRMRTLWTTAREKSVHLSVYFAYTLRSW